MPTESFMKAIPHLAYWSHQLSNYTILSGWQTRDLGYVYWLQNAVTQLRVKKTFRQKDVQRTGDYQKPTVELFRPLYSQCTTHLKLMQWLVIKWRLQFLYNARQFTWKQLAQQLRLPVLLAAKAARAARFWRFCRLWRLLTPAASPDHRSSKCTV